ncbi:RDH16 dehydrogenase, partial [Motacilla alba]|nr:RDH16 dehydrogenase [Motacilla alba]
MWPYVAAALLGLFLLRRWHRERQTVPRLSEKHVLITGCDSGFGNLLARQLDARGLRVLAACLTDTGAKQLRAATSKRLQTVLLDVTSSKSIADVTAWVRERVGDQGLWGLVNNAGIAIPTAPNEWLSKEDFVKVLNVNLVGVVEVTLSLLPLVRRARGRVVNVASVMGRVSCFGGGYCISKFGVEAFSDSLRRELRPFGVRVSIIEPGGFQTGMIDPAPLVKGFARLWERLPAEAQAAYGRHYLDKCESIPTPHRHPRDLHGADPLVPPTDAKSTTLLHRLSSSRLSHVTDAMTHALLSRCPRSRYAAGWDARLIFLPLSYCPAWLSDSILGFFLPVPASGM